MTGFITRFLTRLRHLPLALALTTMSGLTAVAASDDWARPASDALDRIANGLLLLGGGVLVIACGVVGMRYAISQRLQMDNLQAIFFGGFLIFFGGAALKAILAIN